jgi:hypothetical protein
MIIGNGFDLAHNLKTKYSDFIETYWNNIKYEYKDELVDFKTRIDHDTHRNMNSFIRMVENSNRYSSANMRFKLENKFFRNLNHNITSSSNWVDIEWFYYQELKKCLKVNHTDIPTLNRDFKAVKDVFEKYILSIVTECKDDGNIRFDEMANIFEPFHKRSVSGIKFNTEFVEKLPLDVRPGLYRNTATMRPECNLHILVFNYTKTIHCYENIFKKYDSYSINYIHGEAGSKENEVIFGYGDEKDSLFSDIKDLNINSYVDFMKSSSYLKTRNHFDLVNFINSRDFVVDVIGHSCGLSDRTLLKTIFENPKCRQIFLYYRSRKKQDSEEFENNFHDLSINISRHFEDQMMMRTKVANKNFCSVLPNKI